MMLIDYVKISYKEYVHICRTNFAKEMKQNLHETTSQWKMCRKQLFSEDLEVRDGPQKFLQNSKSSSKDGVHSLFKIFSWP
jgi:hypothetical protein